MACYCTNVIDASNCCLWPVYWYPIAFVVSSAHFVTREVRNLTTPYCLLDRTSWDPRRPPETLNCFSGGSWSNIWWPIHLDQSADALVVEGCAHHGHFNRRTRPKSDRIPKFRCEKAVHTCGTSQIWWLIMAEYKANITWEVLVPIDPHPRLIGDTEIDSNRSHWCTYGNKGV